MAIVHKVIILNKPFKLFGFSFLQLGVLVAAGLIGLWSWSIMPPVKINGLPLGFLVFMFIICGGMVFVHASLIQPWQWWRNRILYLAHLMPTQMVPQPQERKIYIEESAKEKNKLSKSGPPQSKWQL